jgi:lincosamide nucleotidyltransferase A/C/D/E
MDAARVLDLLAHLESAGVAVWLDGGWGVDALLGEQTRSHDDLDLVARLDQTASLERALVGRGYTVAGGGAPYSFELVDAEGHQVDVHPASFTPAGDGVYTMAGGGEWIYPAAGFGGRGSIVGRDVPCLTPEVVMVNHTTGYALDEAHQRDVRSLAERYGLPIPAFRTG